MGINYSRLRGLTAREPMAALLRDDFALDRQVGSHQLYRHADKRRVTVAFHSAGQTFEMKTLKTMIESQANWAENDLKRLKLLG